MNNPFVWILIVVIVVIAVPFVGHLIRKKDFKDQITGKKPERALPKDPAAYSKEGQETVQEAERLKLEMQQKTIDNVMGS